MLCELLFMHFIMVRIINSTRLSLPIEDICKVTVAIVLGADWEVSLKLWVHAGEDRLLENLFVQERVGKCILVCRFRVVQVHEDIIVFCECSTHQWIREVVNWPC